MKEPETKQVVIPGVPIKTVRAYEQRAKENDRSFAAEIRRALDAALDLAKGGGGNRTRSHNSIQLAAA